MFLQNVKNDKSDSGYENSIIGGGIGLSYERFKDTFAIDMMMYALGSAFMFSLFDTTLPPPWDWVQALADYTFGDIRVRVMAFFGSKLGPLNVLKPPIAKFLLLVEYMILAFPS